MSMAWIAARACTCMSTSALSAVRCELWRPRRRTAVTVRAVGFPGRRCENPVALRSNTEAIQGLTSAPEAHTGRVRCLVEVAQDNGLLTVKACFSSKRAAANGLLLTLVLQGLGR